MNLSDMKNYFKLLITLVMVVSICCHCSEKEEGTPPPPTEQEGDETPDSESDNPVPETVPSTDGSIDNMESGGNLSNSSSPEVDEPSTPENDETTHPDIESGGELFVDKNTHTDGSSIEDMEITQFED